MYFLNFANSLGLLIFFSSAPLLWGNDYQCKGNQQDEEFSVEISISSFYRSHPDVIGTVHYKRDDLTCEYSGQWNRNAEIMETTQILRLRNCFKTGAGFVGRNYNLNFSELSSKLLFRVNRVENTAAELNVPKSLLKISLHHHRDDITQFRHILLSCSSN